MMPLIVICSVAAAPVLLALIFRVNALFVFLSICVGYFLQYSLSDDVDLAMATVVQGSNSVVAARLVLLGLPLLITVFILRKTRGRSFIFQFVPLLFSGLFAAVLVLPLLPPGLEQSIRADRFGGGLDKAQDLIIASAAITNLVLAYMLFKHKEPRGKHHH